MLRNIALVLLLCSSRVLADGATCEEVEALAARIPILEAPKDSSPPFVLRGAMPNVADHYEYEIVWTGTTYRAALINPPDATPLFLSDDKRAFVCDVVSNRVWTAGPGRLGVTAKQNPDKPMGIKTGIQWTTDPNAAKLPMTVFDFRTATKAAAAAPCTITKKPDGSTVLIQSFEQGRRRTIEFAPPPSHNVKINQYDERQQRLTSYFEIIVDGVDFHAKSLVLTPDTELHKVLEASAPADLWDTSEWQRSGQLCAISDAAAGDEKLRERFADYGFDWNKIAAQYKSLTATWKQQLAKTDMRFTAPSKPVVK